MLRKVHLRRGRGLLQRLLEAKVLLPQMVELPLEELGGTLVGISLELALLAAVVALRATSLAFASYSVRVMVHWAGRVLLANMFVSMSLALIS